jgi:hypothetical protein
MNYRQARELIENALGEMAQTPARRKQIHDERVKLLNKLKKLPSTHSLDINDYNPLYKLHKVEMGEKRSGWTYDSDGKKLRLGKKAKKINEGAVKDMMHDWIEKLPKGAVSEIKSRGSAEKQSGKSIASTLAKHKVEHLMGHPRHGVDAVKMMFDGIHGDLNESVDPTVQSVVEAILAGDSARRSGLIRRSKAKKDTMRGLELEKREGRARGTFAKMVVAPTENIPAHIDPTKRLMKRKTDARGVVAVKKPDFDTPEEAIKHNQKVAHDIIAAIGSKPHGSPVNLYGQKRGGGTVEKKVRVSRKRIMGRDVHVIHGTDREVHLNPSGAGLQVIDAKSKRILMDRGNDADW